MRKNLLLVLVGLFVFTASRAQVLLEEDFEGAAFPSAGWSVINDTQEGTVYHWEILGWGAISGKNTAGVDAGRYGTNEPVKDEQLITPTLAIDDKSYQLSFWWKGAWAAMERGEYEFCVRVSTDDGATWEQIWSFANEEQVEASGVAYPWEAWVPWESKLDLSAYKNKNIKIAFVHSLLQSGEAKGNTAWLDDIKVEAFTPMTAGQLECATTSFTFPQSYIGSKNYSTLITVTNVGTKPYKLTSVEGLEGTDFATTINVEDVVLEKNDAYQFYAIYTPTLMGAPTATLTLVGDGGTPINITLSGSKEMIPQGYTLESFEGAAFPVAGWSVNSRGNYGGWEKYQQGGSTGDNCAYVGLSSYTEMITPRLDLSGDEDYTFTFDFLNYLEQTEEEMMYPENIFYVYLSTDGGNSWGRPIYTVEDANEQFERVSLNLGHPGNNCYVKFVYDLEALAEVTDYDYLPDFALTYVDDVILPPLYGADSTPAAVTLVAPANNVQDMLNKDVVLTWNEAQFAEGYKVYVGTSASNFDVVAGVEVDATTYTISQALEYATTYFWKVVAYNAQGDSEASPIYQFKTLSDATITALPYTQGFDAGLPLGWITTKEGYNNWDTSETGAYDGKESAYASGSQNNTTSTLVTPDIQLPDADAQISFYWGNSVPVGLTVDETGTQTNTTTEANEIDCTYFEIYVDGAWQTLAMLSIEEAEYWLRESISLDAYKGKTVAFRWRYHIINGVQSAGVGLDNVAIETTADKCLAFVNKTEWNAGIVNNQKSVDSKGLLWITNGGQSNLTISNVAFTSDNFTATLAEGATLEANKNTAFVVTYNALAAAGEVKDNMVVSFTNGQSISFPVSGTTLAADIFYFDFEADEHGSITPIGFTVDDKDRTATVMPVMIDYPGIGSPFAYKVLNVLPEPVGADWRNVYPVSGDQVLTAMADNNESKATDDWIISAQMKATAESNFRFYGKSYGGEDYFGLAMVSVWVSTTTPEEGNFVKVLSATELPHSAEQAFTEFNVDLSDYAGQNIYVALQHEAPSTGFVSFFDDFYFEHFAAVESTGVENHTTAQLSLYPNPTQGMLYISGSDMAGVTIYNAVGQMIETFSGCKEVDMSSYAAGVYFVTVTKGDARETIRVIKK